MQASYVEVRSILKFVLSSNKGGAYSESYEAWS